MRVRTTRSIDINASAAQVWRYLTETELQLQWVPGIVSSEYSTGEERVGSRGKTEYSVNRRHITTESELRAIEENRLIEHDILQRTISTKSGTKVKPASAAVRIELAERNGTTTVTAIYQEDARGWREAVGSILWRPFERADMKQSLDRLKTKVENPSASLSPVEALPSSQWRGVATLLGWLIFSIALVTVPFILLGPSPGFETLLRVISFGVIGGNVPLLLRWIRNQRNAQGSTETPSESQFKTRDGPTA